MRARNTARNAGPAGAPALTALTGAAGFTGAAGAVAPATPAPGAGGGLGTALAAEHAAVYAYGVLAARAEGSLRSVMTAAFNAHRARRDRLRAMIIERGGTPAEPDASYRLPAVPSTSAQLTDLAVSVERGVTAAYIETVASGDPAVRRMAALAVQECVVRAYGLRPEIETFPGMPAPAPSSPAATPTPPPPS
ncbi:ferritin-like domain-containing protein [Streptosporangium sp. NPDC048047]|uniref:ferritin-like domain-containing protein n=1 Tax=Streptosporangium sp. NPDC048047 TaxID=3155748 RepID=UPI003438530D